jgi:hypothetical protein
MAKTETVYNAMRGPWGCSIVSLKPGPNEIESTAVKRLMEFEPFVAAPLLFVGPYQRPQKPRSDLTELNEHAASDEIVHCNDPHRLLAWVNAELAHAFPRPGLIKLIDAIKINLLKSMDKPELERFARLEYKRRSTDIPTMKFIEERLLGKSRARSMRG